MEVIRLDPYAEIAHPDAQKGRWSGGFRQTRAVATFLCCAFFGALPITS